MVIEEDSRVLRDPHNFQPSGRLNVDAEAQLSQIVSVVDGGVIESILALYTVAKLSTELNPVGKQLVQSGNWKQPACVLIGRRQTKICDCVGSARSVGWELLGRRIRGLLSYSAGEKYSAQYKHARKGMAYLANGQR